MELKKDSFYQVNGFMITELNLSGCELLSFAIIHTITKSGGICALNREYIAQFTGYSVRQVQRALNNLVAMKIVSKTKKETPKGFICLYKSTYQYEVTLCPTGSDNVARPSDKVAHKKENINFNNINNTNNIYKKVQNIDINKYLIAPFSDVSKELYFTDLSILLEENGIDLNFVVSDRTYNLLMKTPEWVALLERQLRYFNIQNDTKYNLVIVKKVAN